MTEVCAVQTTDTVTLIPGKIGGYSEFMPEVSLRVVERRAADSRGISQSIKVLQQRVTRYCYDTTGAVMDIECEWRDVPMETE